MNQIDLVRRGLDALGRLLLEGVKNPDFIPNLHGVDDAKGVPTVGKRNFKEAGAKAFERLGNVGLPFSAAMVKAVRQTVCASTGNFSNSLRAALIHEIGRVVLVIGFRFLLPNSM